ncbi:hypothetical protein [Haloarcula sp. CGMCC 1.6347]|uniref:hypothetical protein n=1 Tax=Haloarcula sp. CGMCC 1.6347 TaxID=3111455 RepID=UPI00300EEE76
MAGNPNQYIEIGSDGIRFVMEHQSITSNEKTMIPREEVPVDEMPIDNITINGVSNIESIDDDSGQLIRMKYDEVEYTTSGDDKPEDERSFFEKLENETGIAFDDTSQEFIFSENKTGKKNFIDFMRVLFEQGHMTKDDLPYQTKYARNAYLLNTEPVDQKGEQMKRTGEPVEGVYVATHYAEDQKKKYMKQLVNDFVKGESIDT